MEPESIPQRSAAYAAVVPASATGPIRTAPRQLVVEPPSVTGAGLLRAHPNTPPDAYTRACASAAIVRAAGGPHGGAPWPPADVAAANATPAVNPAQIARLDMGIILRRAATAP